MSLQGQIIILDDVLTVTECDQLINYYKSTGHTFEWGGAYPSVLLKGITLILQDSIHRSKSSIENYKMLPRVSIIFHQKLPSLLL